MWTFLRDSKVIYVDPWQTLHKSVLDLMAGIRKNVKNYLISLVDKNYSAKDLVLRSFLYFVKNFMNLEYSRH